MSVANETPSLQNEEELDAFIRLVRLQSARSYLEIGAESGGTLWRVAQALPKGARIVAVDLPLQAGRRSLEACIDRLCGTGYAAGIIWDDSTLADTVRRVRELGPFDVAFIDANHSWQYVSQDWENYGPMARMVAFHDIGWRRGAEWRGVRIDVPDFWNEIKKGYPFVEIKHDLKGKDNGIGVLWRSGMPCSV